MSATVTKLRTRKPTGKPSWPLILLAGESKTGKTWACSEFTGDPRIGQALWLDLGEGCADEYGAVPGANYEIIEHDGTWTDIVDQAELARDFAKAELEAGHAPTLLVIDSMTAYWAMLSEWTNNRAKSSKNNKRLLEDDPDAEIDVGPNYWNDANSRHARLMNILKTFPGIVVMTSLETEKTQMGPGGRPLKDAPKVARPDAQKRVPSDSTVWIRLSLTEAPTIVGIRSVKLTILPGKDKPKPMPDFSLGKLVFEMLGINGDTAEVRNMPVLNANQRVDGEEQAASQPAPDNTEIAARGLASLLAAESDEAAVALRDKAKNHPCMRVDVLGRLDEERQLLGIASEAQSCTLREAAGLIINFVERHGISVAAAVQNQADDLAAAEAMADVIAEAKAADKEVRDVALEKDVA